jgi:hypothetical protein
MTPRQVRRGKCGGACLLEGRDRGEAKAEPIRISSHRVSFEVVLIQPTGSTS